MVKDIEHAMVIVVHCREVDLQRSLKKLYAQCYVENTHWVDDCITDNRFQPTVTPIVSQGRDPKIR